MGKATEIKRKKRHDSTRIKGARLQDPARLRRRLNRNNRFRNKQRAMSKNWDARLENEPPGRGEGPGSRQAPRGGQNLEEMAAALKNSGDTMVNNPFPNEASSDEGAIPHSPFPNEASSDEGNVHHNPFPNELSSDEGNIPHNPFPNEASSEDGVAHLHIPDENLFSHTGQPTSAPLASSTTYPPFAPDGPSKHASASDDRPKGRPSSPTAPTSALPPSRPSLPTIPTITVPTISQPSRPTSPTAPTDNQYPDVPSAGSPSAPSSPTVDTEDPNAPTTPSQDTGPFTPSADPPLIEGPGGPDGPNLPDGPTMAPSTSFDSNPIPAPGAPTKPHKPTLSPAYFNPEPTPRPTKYRPSVPSPDIPTMRPQKSRPTISPTVAQKEPPRPTAGKKTKRPSALPADTVSPTFKPSRDSGSGMGMITMSPTFSALAPTRNPASPDEFPSPDEVPLPTFPPQLPPTDPPTNLPTKEPTELPSSLPTNTTADPTAVPSSLPTPFCKADEEGNYGFPTAPQELVIEYQYQVETTASVTEGDLNNVILPEMEKDISDVLVPALFFRNGECTGGLITAESRTSELGNAIIQDIEEYDKRTAQKWAMNILQQRERDHYQKPKGNRADGWETQSGGQRRLKGIQARQVQESDELVGLTAAPPDFVIRDSLGRLQNACPFPVTGTGPDGQPLECWVIEGRLTVYGFGDLTWVEPVVEESLNEAMEEGDFDNGAVNSNVIYVRSIPPGTELNIPPDSAEGEDNQSQSEGTPVWAWVLIGLGIFGFLLSVVYLVLKRRQQQEDFEREKAETDFFPAGENAEGEGGEGGEGDENAKLVASTGAGFDGQYGEQKEEDGGNEERNEGIEQVYEEQQGGYEQVPEDEANAENTTAPADGGGGNEADSANNSGGHNSAAESRQSMQSRQSAQSRTEPALSPTSQASMLV